MTPAAWTRTRTSVGWGSGTGTFSILRASSPPNWCTRTACMLRLTMPPASRTRGDGNLSHLVLARPGKLSERVQLGEQAGDLGRADPLEDPQRLPQQAFSFRGAAA